MSQADFLKGDATTDAEVVSALRDIDQDLEREATKMYNQIDDILGFGLVGNLEQALRKAKEDIAAEIKVINTVGAQIADALETGSRDTENSDVDAGSNVSTAASEASGASNQLSGGA